MSADPPLPIDGPGAVVTIGNFDGVHLGHQAVLRELSRRAAEGGRRSVLVTFDPHPLRVIRPEIAPRLLTTPAEKKEALAGSGLDYAVFLQFTPQLQQLTARRFVEEILLARFGMRELVVGYDHAFGRGREGNAGMMRSLGRELGFNVEVIEEVSRPTGPVSSSRIRRALVEGDLETAAAGLGRAYSVEGIVEEGMKRGRALGFPTANIRVGHPDKLLPREGIYAVYGEFGEGRAPGLLHLGPRPTFPGYPPSVELYLLDWSGDLYGRRVRVEFAARLRGVLSFDTPAALVEQMRRDEAAARAYFAAR